MAISAIPILPVETISGNQFRAFRVIEESAQTFLAGTPVTVTAADGGIAAWGGATISQAQGAICGISYEAASNLATTGKGAPTPFQPLTGPGAAVGTFGNVPNQPSAINIAHGAPFNDGRVGFYLPAPDTVYSAMFGNAGSAATPANTDVGKAYGLTIDSNSKYWYVDKSKATLGTNAMVIIVGLDLRDVPAAGTRVLFVFSPQYVNLIG